MTRLRTAGVIAALATTAALMPVAALAASSRSTLWQNHARTAVCGIELRAATHNATVLLCSAKGVPGAKGTTNEAGDPFVTLPTTGKPKLVRVSQYQFENQSDKPTTLAGGTKWSTKGITCEVSTGRTVTCTNKSGHGFTIGNGHYRAR
jgi:hypothetical protein